MRFPPGLDAKLRDENARLELWHNHPETPDAPTDSIPGIDDIVTAMRPGVAEVGVVDNHGDRRSIRAGAERIDCPDAVRPWLLTATTLVEISIGATLGPHSDPVRVRLDAAERTLAAAHAVGLIEVEGTDPPEREDRTTRRGRGEDEGGEGGQEHAGALCGAEETTGDRTIEHTSAKTGEQRDDRPGTAWKTHGKYTEDDIARLETGDLTDPHLCAKLIVAYHENDTE